MKWRAMCVPYDPAVEVVEVVFFHHLVGYSFCLRENIHTVEDVAVVFRSGRLGAVPAWIYFRNKRKIVGMKIDI